LAEQFKRTAIAEMQHVEAFAEQEPGGGTGRLGGLILLGSG